MEQNKKGQFMKVTKGELYKGFKIWYDKKGYPIIWINNKSIKLHIYIWEKKNGEKPKGYNIHHKDFKKDNYDIKNLELLSFSDHRKLHAGWIRKNGVWIKKPCKICKKLLPLDNFYPRKGLTPINKCKGCMSQENKDRLKIDLKFREKKRLYLKDYYKKNKVKILKKQKEKWQKPKH